MKSQRLVLCSGVADPTPRSDDAKVIALDSLGPHPNVNIQLQDVSRVLLQSITPRLTDLIEIASYVFSADTAISRGEGWTERNSIESWSRSFRFVIPVRDHVFWSRRDVHHALVGALGYLSDDRFEFEFTELTKERPIQEYLRLGDNWDEWLHKVDRVVMFSGGLDSLAGAAEIAAHGEDLVLVSHRSITTVSGRQRELFVELRKTFPQIKMLHVPVWINKSEKLRRDESTQRTRSFLFSALGTVIANSIGAQRVTFFENGVVSLNLPVADEVVRARASRTTNPLALKLLSELVSLVTDRNILVDNPFVFCTKTDVVRKIVGSGAAPLIAKTRSCHQTMFQSRSQSHCGRCSQCIDRRIAVLAAGQEHFDPENDYETDVFTGQRSDRRDVNMAVDYVRHVNELRLMDDDSFAARFNVELSRAVRPFHDRSAAALEFARMHIRHGKTVWPVIVQQISSNAEAITNGDLPSSCLLALVYQQRHRMSSWRQLADRVGTILETGIPIAFSKVKPANELDLQQQADAILQSSEGDLHREHPLMAWSIARTKPDWSSDQTGLLIEMKYIRPTAGPARITDEIAADITKYSDNGRNVLFAVYDPYRRILDDHEFSRYITAHIGMMVRIIR